MASDLSGTVARGAMVIDPGPIVDGNLRWNCRCLACKRRFTALRASMERESEAPVCPHCRGTWLAHFGARGAAERARRFAAGAIPYRVTMSDRRCGRCGGRERYANGRCAPCSRQYSKSRTAILEVEAKGG